MSINCHLAKRSSTAYIDGRLRSDERTAVAAHLSDCEQCTSYFEQVSLIRSALAELSEPAMPTRLQTNLKVIASRERASVLQSRGSRLEAIWAYWKFRLSEFMRPLALPATGGLISALLLFGTFVFTMGSTTRIVSYDIPLNVSADVEPNLVPFELRSQQLVILNMTVNGSGRVTDYNVADPAGNFTAGMQAQPTSITFPEMPTVFGMAQPISGDIQIKFLPLAFRQ